MLPLLYVIYEWANHRAYNINLVLDLFASYKTHSATVGSAHISKSRTRGNLLQGSTVFRDSNLPGKQSKMFATLDTTLSNKANWECQILVKHKIVNIIT